MHSVHHLEMIAALAKYRHFGRAAEALGISQPGLTKGLLYVERELGVKLFDRASPVQPTAFGEIVLARSSDIITGFAEIRREIDHAKRAGGDELTVSIGVHAAETSGLQAMAEFSASFPAVRCSISIKSWDEVLEDVAAGRCDLGFASITGARENAHLETTHLRSCKWIVFCRAGHPLSGRSSIVFQDLTKFPWVAPGAITQPFPLGDETEGAFGRIDSATGEVKPRLRASTFGSIRGIVLRSDAISAGPGVLIRDDIAEGRLWSVPIGEPGIYDDIGFVWRKSRPPSAAAREFMRIVEGIESRLDY